MALDVSHEIKEIGHFSLNALCVAKTSTLSFEF